MDNERRWDGKHANVRLRSDAAKRVRIDVNERTARLVALVLMKYRQTYLMQPPEVEELCDALNYVLVGDPESTLRHDAMQVHKGMTPDGGHKAPETDEVWKATAAERLQKESN